MSESGRKGQNGGQSVIPLKDRNRGKRPQRAAHSKVRTGCVTCKTRRVKCDEGIPGCNACIKFGTQCEGYMQIPKRVPRYKKERVVRKLPPLYRELLPAFHLESHIDQLYFQYYREEVAPCIGGINFTNPSDLWTRKILQAGFGDSWIYDAIVAISALNVVLKGGSEAAELATEKDSHYATAVRKYGRAITKMRSSLSTGETDIRKAILGCLLVFGFEGFHGNQRLALSHVISGYKLFQGWMKTNPEVKMRNGAVCRGGVIIIEEDIISTFLRLHLQALSVIHRLHVRLSDSVFADIVGDQVFFDMPESMEDFPQALRLINYLLRRVAQYGTFATEVTIAYTISDDSDESMAEIFLENPTSDCVACFSALSIPYACTPTPSVIEESYKRNIGEVTRVVEASKHLYVAGDPANTPAAQYLQLGLLSAQIFLDSTVFFTECAFDEHLENFRTMIRLVKELFRYFEASMPLPTGRTGSDPFGMDPGMLPMLYLIAKLCRDGRIRREAIQLMQRGPRRAGIWDSVLSVKVLEWLTEKEEMGADGSQFIPEENRVRILRIDTVDKEVYSRGAREVTIVYGMRGRDRRVNVKRDVVMWNPEGDVN